MRSAPLKTIVKLYKAPPHCEIMVQALINTRAIYTECDALDECKDIEERSDYIETEMFGRHHSITRADEQQQLQGVQQGHARPSVLICCIRGSREHHPPSIII